MFAAAVTGDVGAGKSTLAAVSASLGATVISADAVAKSQWSKPDVLESAVRRWGSGAAPNGAADFAAIARAAFADDEEYRFMNALIHPGTAADINRLVRSSRGLVVVEIPLLFETAARDWVDYVIYVTAPLDARIRRNADRGWDAGEIARRERFMLGAAGKKKKSNVTLVNDMDMESWERAVRPFCERLFAMASAHEVSAYCCSFADAERISSLLVERRLASGANIVETNSRYRWEGAVNTSREWRLTCYTTERSLRAAMECIRENHPYELPAVTATELAHADPATLEWIVENCG
ncbi:MAG: dephospho-CoA kinase [Synergistaceae bacterium]|jgi:dephospho-CoA kinase|nr:dephospho-CoA kinase [Synergistaceae bacterium]